MTSHHPTRRHLHAARLFLSMGLLTVLFSCQRFDEINLRLETLESKVSTLEEITETLHTFYTEGKVINHITPIEGGYQISFSDGHQLTIYDGVTPLLLIDQDGYWSISYDGGATYNRMKDSNGVPIPATGNNGISIKATTDEKGNYVLVQYLSGQTDSIVDTITTPLSSDSTKIIRSITEDRKTHLITLAMADGREFVFTKAHSVPTSIALLSTQTLLLGKNDTISLEFRVNPSVATFNYDIRSADCQLLLDKVSTARSYVTRPTAYALIRVEQVYDDMGLMKEGQYRAYIADLNKEESYHDNISLVLCIPHNHDEHLEVSSSALPIKYTDNTLRTFSFLKEHNPTAIIRDVHGVIDGTRIRVSSPYITAPTHLIPTFHSNGYKVLVDGIRQESSTTPNDYSQPLIYRVENHYGEYTEYTIEVIHSGLPVVFVDTPDGSAITSKENWLKNANIKIVGTDGALMHEGITAIKGRGNSSWGFPKKSYALKLDNKASILGMPEHKRWVLQANWMDRTLLRNRVAFKLGECTLPYSPRSEYVELILNGKHMGNYLLCEQIRVDENRIDIHSLKTDDQDITGGYLMEIDKNYDEANKFRSAVRDFPYMFKSPDEEELTDTMFHYMQNFINEMEHHLYDDFYSRKWTEYIDMESFVDFWFAAELTSNSEYGWPKSTYMYKDRGGKLCAGPIWDNDWYTFIPASSQQYVLKKLLYYPELFKDREFVTIVKERWPAAKERFKTVIDFIDTEAQRIKSSDRMNISMWPISQRVNYDETLPFDEAVYKLTQAYTTKLNWLDRKISAMP